MSIDAITRTDAGELVDPATEDEWRNWVSATTTRNYVIGDPVLDWLELFGVEKGYVPDHELPTYDPRTDFTLFIIEQGRRFEDRVLECLSAQTNIVTIERGAGDTRSLEAAIATYEAMAQGAEIVHRGVLRDPEHLMYGSPDLLVRSDVLRVLFPDAISEDDAAVPAAGLHADSWHYRVIDVKFTTLHFNAGGLLGNQGSSPAYKAQLYAYNRALGRVQGIEADASYLLGRAWEQTVKKVTSRGFSCLERLAPVPKDGAVANKVPVAEVVDLACSWVREVRRDGATWQVLPDPSRPELYPDFINFQDGPWHAAKRRIAIDLEDLTLLWQVGPPSRSRGHEAGVYRWRDPRCAPDVLGITGEKRPRVLQRLIDINQSTDGPNVQPARVSAAEDEWRTRPSLEFFVDFETVSDLADDFSAMPVRGGQTLIFMIGCGHVEEGAWTFSSFVVDALIEPQEAEIIDAWLAHMESVRARLAPGEEPRVIHWSPAETSTFETAYNSAKERHPDKGWGTLRWYDFLANVVREEPVVVRGAMGFGLKAVAKALHSHGLIETLWGDGPADGLGAMVGAWWCQDEAKRRSVALPAIDLMQEIVRYNEVDCRVMMEAIAYLRESH